MLRRLDDSPAGWKALALTYVEASLWKSHFSSNSTEADTTRPLPLPVASSADKLETAGQTSSRRPTASQRSTLASAFAAVAVLIVFGLGIWLGRTQVELPEQQLQIAEDVTLPDVSTQGKHDTGEMDHPGSSITRQDIPKTVQVVFNDGQSDLLRVLELPMADASQGDVPLDEFLKNRQSVIPTDVRAALEKSGHLISESHDFWPTQLPDGRSVVIPVSQIHVAENPNFTP